MYLWLAFQTLDEEAPLVIEKFRPPAPWPSQGHVRFYHYDLRYQPERPVVLHKLCCEIQPGERIGVVGRTGAGKSSLAVALYRLVEPAAGALEIDGIDVTRLGLDDLRSSLSIIPQEPVLFSGTIRDNLDPWRHHIDHELWRALETCHIKSTVRHLRLSSICTKISNAYMSQ